MDEITKTYTNGEITIVWKPKMCIHSTLCWKGETGLIDVFNPKERPWIKAGGAGTQRIIEQINKCPSGALSFYRNNDKNKPEQTSGESIVEVLRNGPLLVHGNIVVKENDVATHKNKVTAFCRCGASANKPYCDGSHNAIGFVG